MFTVNYTHPFLMYGGYDKQCEMKIKLVVYTGYYYLDEVVVG